MGDIHSNLFADFKVEAPVELEAGRSINSSSGSSQNSESKKMVDGNVLIIS